MEPGAAAEAPGLRAVQDVPLWKLSVGLISTYKHINEVRPRAQGRRRRSRSVRRAQVYYAAKRKGGKEREAKHNGGCGQTPSVCAARRLRSAAAQL